ncbi:MAG: peptidylprolyl isomerase [Hyphomicrobiales bacterium]
MNLKTTFAALIAVAASACLAPPAVAQEEDRVVARVNSYEIRASEVALAAEDVLPQLSNLPSQARYPFLVQYLIERHLLAQTAREQKMDQTSEYKKRLDYYQAKALRDAYFIKVLKPQVTEEDARKEYDKQVAKAGNQEKVRARHILVPEEAIAKEISSALKTNPAAFDDMAKKHAPGSNTDLGYLAADDEPAVISKAAFGLKAGEVSAPVQSKFGWHVIKVEDRKTSQVQPFDKIKAGLIQLLSRQKVQAAVNALTEKAKIEILDKDLEKLRQQKKAN